MPVNPANTGPVVGIDLGGTNLQVGVVDASDQIIGRSKKKTKAEKGPDFVLNRIAEAVHEACEEADCTPADLAAIGIGAPGAIDFATGTVLEAPNLCWNNIPLAAELSSRCANAPVLVDNDVNVAIYGENRLGAGCNAENVLGVWCGTGVGGGLILNGRLYHGGFGSAGEIGQTLLFPTAPLTHRLLEDVCSRTAVAHRLATLIEKNHPSSLPEIALRRDKEKDRKRTPLRDIGSSVIGTAYAEGDELTRTVVHETADLLGRAISNAVTLLALPNVVLGGGLTEALGQPWVDRVAASCREHVFPKAATQARFAATELEDRAGLLGAALLAREQITQPV
ncbi:MAG: ROK family protein [Phycisphaerales bacterium JB050]